MQKIHILAISLVLAVGLAGSANAQDCGASDTPTPVTQADMTGDVTWQDHVVLMEPIFVKDGTTLTILPGTIVRGQPRTEAVLAGRTSGTPGALIVTQTGRLIAEGSATNPIIFTTAAIDNDDDGVADPLIDPNGDAFFQPWDPSDPNDVFLDDTCETAPLAPLNTAGNSNVSLWGGLVILGNAPTNNAAKQGVGYGKAIVEGLTIPGFSSADATYGGVLPHDSSGVLRYVSVRHAGDELGEGNELNGITLGGVGDGTIIDHAEVYCNFDDGIEWFGGTVGGSHLAVAFAGDDTFDIDQGYTGINQFLFGIMPFFDENDDDSFGSRSGDKGGEFDGDDYTPDPPPFKNNLNIRLDAEQAVLDTTPWPLSHPALYNMTIIGSTPDPGQEFTPTFPASTNRGIQFRNGFAGEVFNSIVVNTGAETGIEIDTGIGDGAPGFDAIDNVNNGLSALVSSTLDGGAGLATPELDVVANGDAKAPLLGGDPSCINDPNFPGLQNEDTTFDPTGDAAGKLVSSLKASPINPRPGIGLDCVGGGVVPQGPSLDDAATYRGAFDQSLPEIWTTGWTALNQAGLLAD